MFAEGWGSQTIRLTVSKCNQFPPQAGLLWHEMVGDSGLLALRSTLLWSESLLPVALLLFLFIPSKNTEQRHATCPDRPKGGSNSPFADDSALY